MTFAIGKKLIGEKYPPFVIAEISGNHNQNFQRAAKIVEAACKAGVDAVKLQTYTPDTMTVNSTKKWFQVKVNKAWKGQTLYNLYKKAYTPWEWHPRLEKITKQYRIPLFSSAYDDTSVDFLEKMHVPAYKIASFELPDTELLKKIARTKKPVILSRGMASLSELELAIATLRRNGTSKIAVLHCVSSYPALPEEMNLATIPYLKTLFNVIPGLSDHTTTITTAVAGVAFGACIIEKHVTLDRKDGGVDSAFSLEPAEIAQLVSAVKDAKKAIGNPTLAVGKKESENIGFRRSLWLVKNIQKGEKFTTKHIKCLRPGHGLSIHNIQFFLNRTSVKSIKAPCPISFDLV